METSEDEIEASHDALKPMVLGTNGGARDVKKGDLQSEKISENHLLG